MTHKDNKSGRRRRWIAGGVVILAIVCLAGYAIFTSGGFLEPRVESALTNRLGADIRVQGMDFGLFSGTSVERMTLLVEAREEGEEPSRLVFEDCLIEHEWPALLTGNYVMEQVRVGRMDAAIAPSFMDWMDRMRARPGDGEMDRLPRVEIQRGSVRVSDPSLPRQMEVSDLSVLLGWNQPGRVSGTVSFGLGGNRVRLNISAAPAQGYGDVDVMVHGFDLNALPQVPRGTEGLDPSKLFIDGSFDGSLSLPLGAGGMPPFSGDFFLSETEIGYRGWPLELTDLSARIGLTQNGVSLRDMKTKIGRGRIHISSARFRLSEGELESVSLRGTARELDLGNLTHGSLPWSDLTRGDWGRIYSGTADAEFNLQWAPGREPSYEASVSLRKGSLQVNRLDRRLDNVNVEATVDSSGLVTVDHARVPVAGGEVQASGSLQLVDGQMRNPRLTVELVEIQPTAALVGQLAPSMREMVQRTGLAEPRVTGNVTLSGDEMSCDLGISARAVEPDALPYRFTDFSTDLRWSSSSAGVRLRNISGRINGGHIEGDVSAELSEHPTVSANLFGRGLPVDPNLLSLLPEDSRRQLRGWEPAGNFDLEVRCQDWQVPETFSVDALKPVVVKVDLRDITVSHYEMPSLVQDLFGHISLRNGMVKLTDVNGQVMGATARLNGVVPLPGVERSSTLRMETETVNIDPAWLRRLPDGMGDPIAEMDARGQGILRADVSQLPNEEQPLKASGSAVIHFFELNPRAVPIRISGTTRAEVEWQPGEAPGVTGSVRLQEAGTPRIGADGVSARFQYDDATLQIPTLNVDAYGGKITATESRFNTRNQKWQTELEYAHMDLESLMGAFEIRGEKAPGGVLRGQMSLSGTGMNPETFDGEGQLRIDRGRLYNFPVLLSVFSVLDLGLPSQSPVSDALGTYTIGRGTLTIEDLVFSGGGGMPVHITGTVSLEEGVKFKNRQIDMRVTVTRRPGILDAIPVIGFVKSYTIDLLRQFILQARVKGTFADYNISTVADPVTRPVQAIWSLVPKLNPMGAGGGNGPESEQ